MLTGPNASGKSTILDALLIGASPDPAGALVRAVSRHANSGTGGLWLLGGEAKAVLLVTGDHGASIQR